MLFFALDMEDDLSLDRSRESPNDTSSAEASDDPAGISRHPSQPFSPAEMVADHEPVKCKIPCNDTLETMRLQNYSLPFWMTDPRLWPHNMLPNTPMPFLPFHFQRLLPHVGLSPMMLTRSNGEHGISLLGGPMTTGCDGAAFGRRLFPFAIPPPYLARTDAGRRHTPVHVHPSASLMTSPRMVNADGRSLDEQSTHEKALAMDGGFPWLADRPTFKMKTNAEPAAPRRPMEAPRYQCDACNKSYATFSGLSKHKQFHCESHVRKEFSCKFCEKTYTSLGALKMHIRASVTCAASRSPDRGCFRAILGRTRERSRSRVLIAAARSPTDPTCAPIYRRTPTSRSTAARGARRLSLVCRCS